MCECKNVEFGSYANQVLVETPLFMKIYREERIPGCNPDVISMDACIAEEVKTLWRRGITTTGCCCGHNRYYSNEGEMAGEKVISAAYIGVIPSDIPKMKELGYKLLANSFDLEREDSFVPLSVVNGRHHLIGEWSVTS